MSDPVFFLDQCASQIRDAGGGVCIFVHNSLNFAVRKELSISKESCEILTIELNNNTNKHIIISVMYRPHLMAMLRNLKNI